MRKWRYVILGIVALVLLYLLLWPVPIDPLGWTPPEDPGLTGPYAVNNILAGADLYPLAGGDGPEDTVPGPDGLIYTGLADGSVVRFSPDNGGTLEAIVNTGGRPLGLEFMTTGCTSQMLSWVWSTSVMPRQHRATRFS